MEQESGTRRRRILVPSEEDPLPVLPRVVPPSSFFLKKYVNKKQEWLSRNPQPPGVAPHPVRRELDTYQPNFKSKWEEDRLESLSEHPAEFYEILDSVLRRSAREMGLKIFPDGFFRLSAVVSIMKFIFCESLRVLMNYSCNAIRSSGLSIPQPSSICVIRTRCGALSWPGFLNLSMGRNERFCGSGREGKAC